MKFTRQIAPVFILLGLLALISILAGCSKAIPQDGAQAKMMRFDGLNNLRYCEIFLIGGNPITKDLQGAVYNTTQLNDAGHPQDTCPADMWAKVDIEQLKKQYDLLGVFKNGPRYWMYDWIELPVGTQHDFDGLQARWFAQVQLPKDFKKAGSTYYNPTTVHRASHQGYKAGQTVFILDDPSGTPWTHAGLLSHRRSQPDLRRTQDARQATQASGRLEVPLQGVGQGPRGRRNQRHRSYRSGRSARNL